MTRTPISKRPATDANNIIPFPDKLGQRSRMARDKTGPRILNLVLLQALGKAKELVRRRPRPPKEIEAGLGTGDGLSTMAQRYPMSKVR